MKDKKRDKRVRDRDPSKLIVHGKLRAISKFNVKAYKTHTYVTV